MGQHQDFFLDVSERKIPYSILQLSKSESA